MAITIEEIKKRYSRTHPEYIGMSDLQIASDIWNRLPEERKAKNTFQELSRKIGYLPGTIPESQPLTPQQLKEPSAAEEAGSYLKSLGERAMTNIQAIPYLGGVAGLAGMAARAMPYSRIARGLGATTAPLLPQTGKELARQVGTAATVAPLGLAGEKAADVVAAGSGARGESEKRIAEALRIPMGVGAEILGGAGLGLGSAAIQRRLAAKPASIPEERLRAARQQQAAGLKVSPGEFMRGADVAPQMEYYNRIYNRLVGNPEASSFGSREMVDAVNRLRGSYENILSNKTVTFDQKFFDDINAILGKQRQLADTGVMFAEAKPILNTLSQISSLPRNLLVKINNLKNISSPVATNSQLVSAMNLIEDSAKALGTGKIQMDAKVYNELRSQLGDAAFKTTDKEKGSVLKKMQKAFDDAADRSLPPEDVSRLKDTRSKWENFSILKNAQEKSETGQILPQYVGDVVRKRAPAESGVWADKEIFNIGRMGEQLPVTPSPARKGFNVQELIPTQVGGHRQEIGILGSAKRMVTEPLRTKEILKGPVSPEEVARKQQLQVTRAVTEKPLEEPIDTLEQDVLKLLERPNKGEQ